MAAPNEGMPSAMTEPGAAPAPVSTPAPAPMPASAPAPAPATASAPEAAAAPAVASEPAAAAAPPPEPEKHRVHNSYIWLGSLRAVGLVVVVLIFSSASSIASLASLAADGLSGMIGIMLALGIASVGMVALFGLVVLVHYLAYRHLWYELGPYEFSLCSGIISKKRVHVAYPRVQSVDQRASLIQRLFGVCNVTIDTAGGAANKAILVPYLTKQQADTLRAELFARKESALRVQAAGQRTTSAATATAVATSAAVAGQPASAMVPATAPAAAAATATATAPGPSAAAPSNVLDAGEAAWGALGQGVFGGSAVDTGTVTYEYGLSNKELIFTGLSNNTAFVVVVLAVLAFLAQAIEFLMDVIPNGSRVANNAVDAMGSMMTSAAAGPLIAMAIGGIVVVALVMWGLSVVGACLSFGGFHARRRGDRIEVERGLLQHQIQGVSIARVQSVVVKQSLIRRLLGYCEVSLGKIDAASGDEAQQKQNGLAEQGLIVHPFVKVSRVPEILAGLVPEFADVPTDQQRLPKPALRRAILRRTIWQGGGFWLAVCVALCQVLLNVLLGDPAMRDDPRDMWVLTLIDVVAALLYALAAVLVVLDAVGAVLWYRHSSFAVNRRFMQLTNGGLSTETVTFPRQKIQYGSTKTNPLQRRAHTATINARTAAGVGGTTVRLIDVSEDAAARWLEWLQPHAA